MTQLVGVSSFGTPVNVSNFATNGNATRSSAGYIAISGIMQTAHVQVGIAGTASQKGTIYVYSGAGPGALLVATSAEFATDTTGDLTAAISGTLSAGTYTLEFQTNAVGTACQNVVQSGSSGANNRQNTAANFPYRAAPGTMPAADVSTGQEFIIWIDGVGTADNSALLPFIQSKLAGPFTPTQFSQFPYSTFIPPPPQPPGPGVVGYIPRPGPGKGPDLRTLFAPPLLTHTTSPPSGSGSPGGPGIYRRRKHRFITKH